MIALNYVFAAMPYVIAVGLGLLVPTLGVLCYSRFSAGVAVTFLMFIVEALFMEAEAGGIFLGINLFFTDLAMIFIGVVAGFRLLMARDFPRRHWGWLLFCAAVFLSLATGIVNYGSSAGVQARPYFYLVATGVYGMSFAIEEQDLRVVFNWLVGTACLLVCLSVFRWIVYYLPISQWLPRGGAYNLDQPIRVIRSHEALVIVQALVVGMFFGGAARALFLARLTAPVTLAATVALQHRSVWLAGIVGMLAAVLVGRSGRRSRVTDLLLVSAIFTATALPLVFSERLSGVSEQAAGSAENALAGRGTAGERLESWQEIIKNWVSGGPKSIAVGQSFGTNPGRYVHDSDNGGLRKIEYTAHNFYVQSLFSTGLIGFIAFGASAIYVLLGLYRICSAGTEGQTADALWVVLVMQMVYYVPYGGEYLQSLIFGAGLAYVAGRQRAAAAWPEARPHRADVRSRWA